MKIKKSGDKYNRHRQSTEAKAKPVESGDGQQSPITMLSQKFNALLERARRIDTSKGMKVVNLDGLILLLNFYSNKNYITITEGNEVLELFRTTPGDEATKTKFAVGLLLKYSEPKIARNSISTPFSTIPDLVQQVIKAANNN